MRFSEAIKSGFKKCFLLEGRASRSEYWYWSLFVLLGSLLTAAGDVLILNDVELMPINLTFIAITLLPGLSVSVRRLHDVDKSGWWLLLVLSVVGIIPLLFWSVKQGDPENNRFGSNPDIHTGESRIVKIRNYTLAGIASLVYIALVIIYVLTEVGFLPSTKILKGDELPTYQYERLFNAGVVSNSDKIEFFYSESPESVVEAGQVLTDTHLIVYGPTGDDKKYIERIPVALVSHVEAQTDEESVVPIMYKVFLLPSADYEFVTIFLSNEGGVNEEFISRLTRMNNK